MSRDCPTCGGTDTTMYGTRCDHDATPPQPADPEAAAVWERLDAISRESVRLGACEPTPGGTYRHHELQIAGLVERKRVAVSADEGGPVSFLVWRFTDLGRRVAAHGRKAGAP